MSSKILLADDSPTIQKVIKITFANEPYDILECSNESDLFRIVKNNPVDLVLLDFNLSEDVSGYDLAKKIKDIRPSSKVLMMFGTFDNIDENALKTCGLSGKVVKPFESSKFVGICNNLLDEEMGQQSRQLEADAIEESGEGKNDLIINFDREDEWVVNSSGAKNLKDAITDNHLEIKVETGANEKLFGNESKEIRTRRGLELERDNSAFKIDEDDNSLESQIKDWGMAIPPVLDKSHLSKVGIDEMEIPPLLDEGVYDDDTSSSNAGGQIFEKTLSFDQSQFSLSEEQPKFEHVEQKLPNEKDLAYPDDFKQLRPEKSFEKNSSPKFIALDELSMEEEDNSPGEETDPNLSISFNTGVNAPGRNLEDQIAEEVSSDKFWEEDDKNPEELQLGRNLKISPKKEEETQIIFPNEAEGFQKNESDRKSSNLKESRVDDLVNEMIHKFADGILETMKPVIEDNIRKYCQHTIEKVAWEILPDLAENIIKKELGNLSDSVKRSRGNS